MSLYPVKAHLSGILFSSSFTLTTCCLYKESLLIYTSTFASVYLQEHQEGSKHNALYFFVCIV